MFTLNKSGFIEGFNQGEPGARTWVYNRYYADVDRIVEKLVGYSRDNKDLVGDVFLKVMGTKTQMGSMTKLRDFIYMTSRTTCLDYIRKQELKQGSDMSGFYQNLDDYGKELADLHTTFDYLINDAASRLPEKYQRILIMLYHDALSIEEIAEELGLSEKTVANLKSEALRKLKLAAVKTDKEFLLRLFSFL